MSDTLIYSLSLCTGGICDLLYQQNETKIMGCHFMIVFLSKTLSHCKERDWFSSWSWRSKLPCCESVCGRTTWQETEGRLQNPVAASSQQLIRRNPGTPVAELQGHEFFQQIVNELGSIFFSSQVIWRKCSLAHTLTIPI